MKKVTLILMALAAVVLLGALCGCSNRSTPCEIYAGVWERQDIPEADGPGDDTIPITDRFTLFSSGKVVWDYDRHSGEWSVEGDVLYIFYTDHREERVFSLDIQDESTLIDSGHIYKKQG